MKPIAESAGFRDQMLAAAESDFEPYGIDRRIEQRREVRRTGPPMSSDNCGSRCAIRSA